MAKIWASFVFIKCYSCQTITELNTFNPHMFSLKCWYLNFSICSFTVFNVNLLTTIVVNKINADFMVIWLLPPKW